MVNLIWLAMILIGIIVAAINGNLEAVTEAAFAATEESITIILEIAGIMTVSYTHLIVKKGNRRCYDCKR